MADLACACGATEGVAMEPSRTQYHWDGTGKNPNADIPLCRSCSFEHHAYWDEQWKELHANLL